MYGGFLPVLDIASQKRVVTQQARRGWSMKLKISI
jgi:hypothetical protein